jgi:predicted RNA binding protein YcfA (HicA-like mRNA interferase family)
MKQISGKDFAKILEHNGWELIRIKGSHYIYEKHGYEEVISVPIHGNKTLRPGLLLHLMKIAKLSEKDI